MELWGQFWDLLFHNFPLIWRCDISNNECISSEKMIQVFFMHNWFPFWCLLSQTFAWCRMMMHLHLYMYLSFWSLDSFFIHDTIHVHFPFPIIFAFKQRNKRAQRFGYTAFICSYHAFSCPFQVHFFQISKTNIWKKRNEKIFLAVIKRLAT